MIIKKQTGNGPREFILPIALLQYRISSVHVTRDHFFSNMVCSEKGSFTDAHRLS